MKIPSTLLVSIVCLAGYACNANNEIDRTGNPNNLSNTSAMKVKITIGADVFTATLADNETAAGFKTILPVTISMIELNRNEKYFELSDNLPVNASNPGTIQAGDLMLYGSHTLVLFYKTFSTSYNYTRLGHMDDPSGLAAALGSGDATVKFELE